MAVTEEQFYAYETVRLSGQTNMFDAAKVIKLAKKYEGVALTKETITEIVRNYRALKAKYEPEQEATDEQAG